ncbi:hypothetical protein ACWGIU_19825 [Streptomyces sp. NPDC054840]
MSAAARSTGAARGDPTADHEDEPGLPSRPLSLTAGPDLFFPVVTP